MREIAGMAVHCSDILYRGGSSFHNMGGKGDLFLIWKQDPLFYELEEYGSRLLADLIRRLDDGR